MKKNSTIRIYLIFSLLAFASFFLTGLVHAQSCSGSITCYCNPSVRTCSGCSDSCSIGDPYCVLCSSCPSCCSNSWSTCSGQCTSSGGSCVPGVFCDVGIASGSCSSGSNCGNGTCGAGESCNNCVADCGTCVIPSPSPVVACGDGACNGTETPASCSADCGTPETCGNGSCAGGENCSNCSADCGACTGCGDNICSGSENCSGCPEDCGACSNPNNCGNGTCGNNETCSNCPADCGGCQAPFCGNGSCAGSENCTSCPGDCGACPLINAWFQVLGGNAYAGQTSSTAIQAILPSSTCSGSCKPYVLVKDQNDTDSSVGVAITGGGAVETGGYTTEGATTLVAQGTGISRSIENYSYFYRRFSLGLTPAEDFGTSTNVPKPTYDADRTHYYHNGDMTIESLWDIPTGESYVIFVNGNLTFSDPSSAKQLTNVADGGFLAFIVSGDIIIDDNVSRPVGTATSNLEGVFIADGQITVETAGAAADNRFNGEGTFVGWSGVDLQRDLSGTDNETVPAERFVYRPDLVKNTPQEMKRSQVIWQETN